MSCESTDPTRLEILRSSRTSGSFKQYAEAFGYNDPSRLKDKKILDVGAGNSDFSSVASTIAQCVVSLDPNYPNYETRHPRNNIENPLVGFAQRLPFSDNSFDEVVAMYSLCWVITRRNLAITEMIRVTKPNGRIKIHPVSLDKRGLQEVIAMCSTDGHFPKHELSQLLRLSHGKMGKTLGITKDESLSQKQWSELARIFAPTCDLWI